MNDHKITKEPYTYWTIAVLYYLVITEISF